MNRAMDWIARNRIVAALWAAMAVALLAMTSTGPVGWDALTYWKAIEVARHGGDPYVAGIAVQQAFQDKPVAGAALPVTYVYSPMTLPLLRLLTHVPAWLLGALYGAAIVTGALLVLWAGFKMADEEEQRWLKFVLPAVVFFPGLVTDDVLLSANVVYVLYGIVFAAAVPGWKRGRWFWYYAAVLVTSIFKAPLLTLLAFPVLVGRRQWLPAGVTAGAGLFLFGVQGFIWPELFHEYLLAVKLQFDWNHDFGYGPGGLLGKILWYRGIPYSPATTIFYLVFGVALCAVLAVLRRRVQVGRIARRDWVAMAMFCTLLFNPRIMKYDLAPFTVPMLLIGWRALRGQSEDARSERNAAVVAGLAGLLAVNVITVAGPSWAPVELIALLVTFVLGSRQLYRGDREESRVAVPMSVG
jgi:hypothetical protein